LAIQVYGVTGSMDTLHFNQIALDIGDADKGMSVMEGLDVALTTNLGFTVAPGRSLQAGTDAFNLTTFTGAVGTRSATTRIDRVVMQVTLAGSRDTAGSIVVVPGRAASGTSAPVAPGLIQDVLGRGIWQTPLAQITVPPTGSLTVTDDRPGLSTDLPFVQMIVTGATWSQDSPAFGVSRRGDWVEMTGALLRTGASIATSGTATFGDSVVIPAGYRPRHSVVAHAVSGIVANDIAEQRFIFQPDGTCVMYVTRGTLATGRVLRLDTTTYLGA
jgi:hypothetical protein